MIGHGILEITLIAALLLGLAPFLADPKTFMPSLSRAV